MRGLSWTASGCATRGEGEIVEVVLDRTPLYAEAGGQDSRRTVSSRRTACELEVLDVQKLVPQLSCTRSGCAAARCLEGQRVLAQVDPVWRVGARQVALRHARGARGAAPGARHERAAGRFLQQAGLPAA